MRQICLPAARNLDFIQFGRVVSFVSVPHSSSGQGHRALRPGTGVRIPYGAPWQNQIGCVALLTKKGRERLLAA